MQTIRAAVCTAAKTPLEIQDIQLAAPTGRAVEVTIKACAICHSDIAFIDGYWGCDMPAVFGHEAAGEVTAVGDGVSGYRVGDRVIVTLIRACGTCGHCGTGSPTRCDNPSALSPLALSDGTRVTQAMNSGAFAEKVVVDQSQLAKIPDAMPYDAASLLSCGVITGVGSVVNSAGLRPGQDAVVIGAGGVGLNAIQGARIAGARRIVAVDVVAEKLDAAKEFGATDGVLATDPAPWDAVHALLGKGADAVIVTVGAIQAHQSAPNYLAPGGKALIVGMPPEGAVADLIPVNIASLGQQIVGSKMGDTVLARDIPWLADLYLQGRLKLDEMISGRWTLDQINDAIADTKSGSARRNVILF
ncbi:MAG: Zn-dependent alcohol dehydrogenase [Pseudomonadota bacterium]